MKTKLLLFLILCSSLSLYAQDAFITKWKILYTNGSLKIPTIGSGYNYTVDWGDGTIETEQTGDATHTYAVLGEYFVSITGDFPRIYFKPTWPTSSENKFIDVVQWGTNEWASMEEAFKDCNDFQFSATDAPDLSKVLSMAYMFQNATNFNSTINHWDVSNVTDMQRMFDGATSYNRALNNWNVGNVVYMNNMFYRAVSFNKELSNWNVAKVASMVSMFNDATNFNQDIGNWLVSEVVDMSYMFNDATNFNQNIGSWNVLKVANMRNMFHGATDFNQDLNSWNVSNVTSTYAMFYNAISFDQALGNWKVNKVNNMQYMFDNSKVSTENFDATLLGWSTLSSLQQNVKLNAVNVSYCDETGRNILQNNYNWNVGGYKDCSALQITIPNANFEQALIDLGHDTNGLNGNILKSDAEAITDLDISSKTIADVTGIEAMINITKLNIEGNTINSIDLSKNSKLNELFIGFNPITNIDISQNINLKMFSVFKTSISTFDVSKNINLEYLDISDSEISTIDISNNTNLLAVNFSNNQISTLNTTNNTKLEQLRLGNNMIENLDLSNNVELTTIVVSNNKLTNLEVTKNVKLKLLQLQKNDITQIDLKKNSLLEAVYLDNNNLLTKVNLKNSSNSIIHTISLNDNPNLTCVEVDNVAYATENWTNIDDSTVYNTDCSFPDLVYIPDANLKADLLADSQINTNGDDEIQVSEAEAVADFLNANDLGISDLTGVEAFVNITGLSINNNNLTSIDLSKNIKLTFLACANNNLKSLDVTNNPLLETLGCYDNKIKYLDLSNSKTLYNFSAQRNELEYLNIKNGNNNRMSDFYVKDNPNLECIQVDDETWSTTYWGSTKDASASFSNDCGGVWEVYTEDDGLETALVSLAVLDENNDGKITYEEAQAFVGDLDLSGKNITDITGLAAFSNAASINISGNSITDINKLLNSKSVTVTAKSTGKKQYRVRDSSNGIKKLNVSNNLIKEIDISQVTSITELLAANNRLVYVNLNNGVNESLLNLDVTGNSELSCIQVDNVANASSNINWKKDASASYNTNCQKGPLSVANLLKEHLQIYPNPVSQNFTIKLTAGLVFEKAEVYNLLGTKIASSELETVDISQLPSGIYIVKIKTEQGLIVSKISKR